ncbi:MAG TPA: hypothetical protein VGG25_16640 [Streptosporangiaceae bacterium]|jgi:hypothetical protein
MDVSLYWLRSQRDRVSLYEWYRDSKLAPFARLAAMAGMDLEVVTADELAVSVSQDGKPAVYLRGRELDPAASLFHTKVMTWPAYQPDALRHLTLVTILEAAGFCTTVPAWLNQVNNDKLLSYLRMPAPGIPVLPTLYVMTRQFGAIRDVADPAAIRYPVLVKPAGWGGGFGVFSADNETQLNSVLQLAGAAELTMVIQPLLEPPVTDCRVYCIGGEPVAAVFRTAPPRSLVGNYTQGGKLTRGEVPAELAGPAGAMAAAMGIPYACVDFLRSGERGYWFSEIEVDGGGPGEAFEDLGVAKFAAFRAHFDAYLARRAAG